MDLLQQNETNGGEKENRGIKRKRRGKKTRVQKVTKSERVCSMREEGKFILVQKYRYGRKRYLCYVLSKTSTCYSNCSTERVCSV